MKALVVTSKPAARAWLRAALGDRWACDEASDGARALKVLAEADDIDLVIADESTQPYGAFGLTREIKIMPWPPAVIVVLDRPQDTWLATWSGADRWLVQPVDPFDLARIADELIEAQEQLAASVETEQGEPAPS